MVEAQAAEFRTGIERALTRADPSSGEFERGLPAVLVALRDQAARGLVYELVNGIPPSSSEYEIAYGAQDLKRG